MIEVPCLNCGHPLSVYGYEVRTGKPRFCSRGCAARYRERGRRIEISCEGCGQKFERKVSEAGRFCSRSCKDKWQTQGLRGSVNPNWKGGDEERQCLTCGNPFIAPREQLSKGLGKFCSHRCAGQYKPPHIREVIGAATRKRLKDPVFRARWLKAVEQSGIWERAAAHFRSLRASPQFQRAMFKGLNQKPNKKEMRLLAILDRHWPGEWEYTGDGEVIINGLAPDFRHKTKPLVIELFGDYWHSARRKLSWHQTELGRMMSYNGAGVECLVLWEKDLVRLSEADIVSLIGSFARKRQRQRPGLG